MSIYLHLSLPVTPSRLGFVSKGNLNRLDNILCFTIGINSQYPVWNATKYSAKAERFEMML